MIQVEAATWEALCKGATVRPILRWALREGAVDLSDRIIEEPRLSSSVGAFLGPERTGSTIYTLRNDDGALTPADIAGSLLKGRKPAEYFGGLVEYLLAITRADGTEEEIPITAGVASDIRPVEARAELTVQPLFDQALNREVTHRFLINTQSTLLGGGYGPYLARALAIYNAGLTFGDDFDDSWEVAEPLMRSMDWELQGDIAPGSRVGDGMFLLAASSGCQITTSEDGQLRISPILWPGAAGDQGFLPWLVPGVFDETNSLRWRYSRPVDLGCTEIAAQYGGVEVTWRNQTDEAQVGQLRRTIPTPYCGTVRQAALMARLTWEQHHTFPAVVSFITGSRGFVVQLNDRIQCKDPYTNTIATYRVTSKQTFMRGAAIEAVADGHETSVVNGTFAQWGVTTWDNANAVLL